MRVLFKAAIIAAAWPQVPSGELVVFETVLHQYIAAIQFLTDPYCLHRPLLRTREREPQPVSYRPLLSVTHRVAGTPQPCPHGTAFAGSQQGVPLKRCERRSGFYANVPAAAPTANASSAASMVPSSAWSTRWCRRATREARQCSKISNILLSFGKTPAHLGRSPKISSLHKIVSNFVPKPGLFETF